MFSFHNGHRRVLSKPSSKRLNRWFSHHEVSMQDEAALSSKTNRLHGMNCFSALLDVSDTIIDSFREATIYSRSAKFSRRRPSLSWRELTWPNNYSSFRKRSDCASPRTAETLSSTPQWKISNIGKLRTANVVDRPGRVIQSFSSFSLRLWMSLNPLTPSRELCSA